MDLHEDLTMLEEYFAHRIPFNQVLGLHVELGRDDRPLISFDMRDDLVGNSAMQILHGGVTAAVLDVAGGLVAGIGGLRRMRDHSRQAKLEKLSRLGTIDLRVDYLRPGRGSHFVANAEVLRTGNKVSVTRMELHNDEGILIAVGTGAYIIG